MPFISGSIASIAVGSVIMLSTGLLSPSLSEIESSCQALKKRKLLSRLGLKSNLKIVSWVARPSDGIDGVAVARD